MFSKFILLLKSILFGVSNLIPGGSGGTTLVICGIYDETLESISNIRKTFKKSIIFLAILLIGTVIGVLGGGILIKKILLKYIPFITICGFAGIIIGTFPSTIKPVIKKINWKYFLSFLISLSVIIGFMLLGYFLKSDSTKAYNDLKATDYILLFLCGFIGIFAMIIPGVSGILIFLILGYYEPLLTAISNVVHIHSWPDVILFALPVGLGILCGIIPAAKIIRKLMKKFPIGSYYAIIGFVIGSIVCIFFNYFTNNSSVTIEAVEAGNGYIYPSLLDEPWRIIVGVIVLLLGVVASFMIAKITEKNNKDKAFEEKLEEINTLNEDIEEENIEENPNSLDNNN